MVCSEESTLCIVFDKTLNSSQNKYTLLVRRNYTVARLISEITTQYQYPFDLILQPQGDQETVKLSDHPNKTLEEIGIKFPDHRNVLIMQEPPSKTISMIEGNSESAANKPIGIETEMSSDDDLALGASASPTEPQSSSSYNVPLAPQFTPLTELFETPASTSEGNTGGSFRSSSNFRRCNEFATPNFVGLVNQAMTCYLNSLLQALYMTPEFRNALYNWEFDGNGETKSIPYQLQKLFVNLQTSDKLAVETTDLTKSFGWDSTEAWQQHDIQELCRVMFDALEQKFKSTHHADLINRLYEGKMIDYVTCLECNVEKSREDTFLDIPLPVKPFGSTIAFGSVEDALKAFVTPETLDGNNQYFCEKCNKKCDAHKGLKFSKFPYILTLHLKRFDFDYTTLHRIKLNDKVTFPQTLNLNSFINASQFENGVTTAQKGSDSASIGQESTESAVNVKFDDCSTTDSGSALEDENAHFGPNHHHQPSEKSGDQESQDDQDDEGIDMSTNGDCKSLMSNSTSMDSSNNNVGPYNYELFSIMIHSGSASGGHYYAYIKDFETNKWYSFNDQTVSTITHEDIAKIFGGGAKGYYSGAYTSSTNAYMLMYRQIDSRRNMQSVKDDEFPVHIKELMKKMRDREESDRKAKERESEMVKLKVYYKNQRTQNVVEGKVYLMGDSLLEDTLEYAYQQLKMRTIAPMDRCRLVAYDHMTDNIDRSFEGKEKHQIGDIMKHLQNSTELLMEVRDEGKEFDVYAPNGVTTKVYVVNVDSFDYDGPHEVRGLERGTVADFKKTIAKKLELDSKTLLVAFNKHTDHFKMLDDDETTLKAEHFYPGCKIFVTNGCAEGHQVEHKLKKLVERFGQIVLIYFVLPDNNKEVLDKMSIPRYSPAPIATTPSKKVTSCDVVDATMLGAPSFDTTNDILNNNTHNNLIRRVSPLPPPPDGAECNSEDSSLSDSDRTLVDDLNQSHNNSPIFSDPLLSSLENSHDGGDTWCGSGPKTYFKAVLCETPKRLINSVDSGNENDDETSDNARHQKVLKVMCDKAMSVGKLKEFLQPYIKVPMEFFKIFKMSQMQTETECTRLTETVDNTFRDSEQLVIELGRALRKDEHKCKLYYLNLSEINDDTDQIPFICEYILRNGAEVGQTKREILAHITSVDEKYTKLTFDTCRLRKKSWKNPSTIYFDEQKFGDDILITASNLEIIIQEVSVGETETEKLNDDNSVLFVRQFSPSKFELGKFDEIVLGGKLEIKTVLSKLSGIPAEHIMYAKLNGSFPRGNQSILQIPHLTWFSTSSTVDESPLMNVQDGTMYLFKDKEETPKELTLDEKNEIQRKENIRNGGSGGTTSTYSPRRERALKIYLDSSPNKKREGL